MNQPVETSVWIEKLIKDFIDYSLENTLKNQDNDKAFETPLVGFSKGDDPLYEAYKEHVGAFHWTPWEIFTRTFPELVVKQGELSVISWVLPMTESTKADNHKHIS